MIRHLSPLPRRPGGGAWPSRSATAWSLRDFGASYALRAPLLTDPLVGSVRGTLTLSGSDVVSAVDSAGGSIVLSRVTAGQECTYDTSLPFNGRGSVRTSRTTSALRSLTGGVSASLAPHYMAALAAPVSIVANASNFGTWILMGQPGGLCNGIGSSTPPDSFAWGGNTIGSQQYATFDTSRHLFESAYDGTKLRAYLDGVFIAERTVAITLSGADAASIGLQSWFGAARAIPDTHVYGAVFKTSVPTFADRMHLATLLGEGAHTIPMRIDGKGDSRTLGTGSTAGNDYLTQLGLQFAGAGRTVAMVNHGLSGKRSDEIEAALDVRDVAELHSPFCTNVSLLWSGYNDFSQWSTHPTTAAAVYANTCLMIDFDHLYGNKAFVMTVPTSGPFQSAPAAEALRVAYNALVLANAGGADGVIDVAPYFDPYSSANYSDTLHFNNASQLLIAEIVYDYLSTRV